MSDVQHYEQIVAGLREAEAAAITEAGTPASGEPVLPGGQALAARQHPAFPAPAEEKKAEATQEVVDAAHEKVTDTTVEHLDSDKKIKRR